VGQVVATPFDPVAAVQVKLGHTQQTMNRQPVQAGWDRWRYGYGATRDQTESGVCVRPDRCWVGL